MVFKSWSNDKFWSNKGASKLFSECFFSSFETTGRLFTERLSPVTVKFWSSVTAWFVSSDDWQTSCRQSEARAVCSSASQPRRFGPEFLVTFAALPSKEEDASCSRQWRVSRCRARIASSRCGTWVWSLGSRWLATSSLRIFSLETHCSYSRIPLRFASRLCSASRQPIPESIVLIAPRRQQQRCTFLPFFFECDDKQLFLFRVLKIFFH